LLAASNWYVRERAIVYLGKAGDAACASAIRPLLSGETIGEREHAAEALAALGDRESIPGLEGLLHDSNPNGRIAAAQALVTLHAVESIPALEAAISTDTSWAKPQLEQLLAELRVASAP
jgi:HEAT repeat protein